MSPQARDSRAEERRLSIRTLAIASASSATAAIVTSRLWAAGTPIAAAMTPVIVTIVSESLHGPTSKIAERLTVETRALPHARRGRPPSRDVSGQEGPEPVRRQPPRDPAPPGQPSGDLPDDVRVYRSGSRKPRLSWKLIAGTAALAFVIGLVVLTLPQVFAGQSLLKGSPPGYGSASKKKDKPKPAENDSRPAPAPTQTEPDSGAPAPQRTTTTEEPEPETAPETITPAPEREPPADAPAPRSPTQTTPQPAPQ